LLFFCFRDGDVYAALRDCQTAVQLDPSHSKAYYRQARCLYELKWYEEANICLQSFKEKFVNSANGYSLRKLEEELSQQLHLYHGNHTFRVILTLYN